LEVACREQPDLILCDVQMSGMDGLEFVRLAKASEDLKAIPVVAVTAYAMVGDRERLLAAGFDGYIAKPIDPQTISAIVNTFLRESLRATSPPMAPLERSAPAQQPLEKAVDILVLDDSPVNLELKRALLEPYGYTVRTASDMASALVLARARVPDLIISDVGMTQGSGFDVIQAVKADPKLRDVPFIFLSATHWGEAWRERGLRLGAVRYLTRPMDPQLLLAEIRACIRP